MVYEPAMKMAAGRGVDLWVSDGVHVHAVVAERCFARDVLSYR